MGEHVLSWMTFMPVIGAAVIMFIPAQRKEIIKTVAAAAAAVPLILAVQLYMQFDRASTGFQFVEHYTWIKSFNIEYFVGVDGISVAMVLLTALLSWGALGAGFLWILVDRNQLAWHDRLSGTRLVLLKH